MEHEIMPEGAGQLSKDDVRRIVNETLSAKQVPQYEVIKDHTSDPIRVCTEDIGIWNSRNPGRTPVAYIDFEGYYDNEINIEATGSRVYASQTDLYMVAIRTTTGIDYVGDPLEFDWSLINGMVWVSHNMSFDFWPIKYTLDSLDYDVVRYSEDDDFNPRPEPSEWNCTANLCASLYNVRSLREACVRTLGMDCSKAVRDAMKGVDYRTMPPEEQNKVKEYCRTDTALGMMLWLRNSDTWLPLDRKLSEHTIIAPTRGICIDTEKLYTGIDKVKVILTKYEQVIPWRKYDVQERTEANPLGQSTDEKGKLFVVRNRKKIKEYCDSHDIPCPVSLAVTDPDCNAWLEKYGEAHPVLKAIQRHGSVNTVLQKHYSLESLLDYDKEADRPAFTPSLLFYGGHTGRWSGGMYEGDGVAFNIQNLARVGLKEDESVYMRSYLVPRPGHKFFISDLSQIEPRVLYYLAGDFKMLNKCRETSIYQAFAEVFLGYVPGYPGATLKKENPELYLLAKCMVLGLGYGLGTPEKFVGYCKNSYNLDISLNKAREAIMKYRHTNPRVVTFWNNLGHDIVCAWNGDPNKHLEIGLPSGRSLNYYLTSANTAYQGLKRPANNGRRLYGAKLAENVVQGSARDVFGNCVLNLEAEEFRVMFHSHDEAIIEHPCTDEEYGHYNHLKDLLHNYKEVGFALDAEDIETVKRELADTYVSRTINRITETMRIPPDFLPLIPLDSECVVSDHYCK